MAASRRAAGHGRSNIGELSHAHEERLWENSTLGGETMMTPHFLCNTSPQVLCPGHTPVALKQHATRSLDRRAKHFLRASIRRKSTL
jgi:hypothetical protein